MNIVDLDTFVPMAKIPRLNRGMLVTEKIDGSNASIHIRDDGAWKAASRTRWLDSHNDNYGFFAWVHEHIDELRAGLGPGHHFGEWWGQGINRNYGLDHRRFSLFNVHRWDEVIFQQKEALNALRAKPNPAKKFAAPPACCSVVPVLAFATTFNTFIIRLILDHLKDNGSTAVKGWMRPEGIVVYHEAAGQLFKVTVENDEQPKSAK